MSRDPYKKSWRQRKKEAERRDRVFELLTDGSFPTDSEIAEQLNVSRSTVQRDKRKLKRRIDRYLKEEKAKWRAKFAAKLDQMNIIDRYLYLSRLMQGKHLYKLKPRGKPFTSEYQPRWKKKS